MATYDLNQSQLYSVLGGSFISTHSQSPATIGTIIGALQSANEYPSGGLSVNSIIQDDTNSTATLNLTGDTIGFFLETGSNATVNVESTEPYGIVVAAGDGSGVILNDFAGNDTLVGGAGPDTLNAGVNSDLIAGSGNNALYGGFSSDSNDTLQGGSGSDTLTVTTGNNTLIAGNGAETLNAGSGMDTLFGGGGPDSITGGANTTIYTGSGSETINAAVGADSIYVGFNTPHGAGGGGLVTITGNSHTVIDINANYSGSTAPVALSGGNYTLTFSNGSASTTVDFNGGKGVTLDYLNKTITPA